MSTKTRFVSKPNKSVQPGGSGSKRGNNAALSGVTSNAKGGQIQVFHNGKIVTPQSLLPRGAGPATIPDKGGSNTSVSNNDNNNISNNVSNNVSNNQAEDPKEARPRAPMLTHERKASVKNMSIGDFKLLNKKQSDESMTRNRSITHQQAPIKVMEEVVAVTMSETETSILLSLPSLVMTSEAREVVQVEENNARYEALLESRSNADGYTEHNTQTLNYPQKNQNDMVASNASQDVGAQAYSYDISDSINREFNQNTGETDHNLVTDNSEKEIDTGLSPHVQAFVQQTVNLSINTPGCLLDALAVNASGSGSNHPRKDKNSSKSQSGKSQSQHANANNGGGGGGSNVQITGESGSNQVGSNPGNTSSVGGGDEGGSKLQMEEAAADYGNYALKEATKRAILDSGRLMKRLQMVERAVQQNAHHEHILEYRSLPDVNPLVLESNQDKVAVIDSVDQLFGGGLSSMAAATPASVGVGDPASSVVGAGGSGDAGDNPPPSTEEQGEKVKKLFTYSAPALVRGRTVTCMAWNAENTDLLAVGYGRVDFVEDNAAATTGSGKSDLNEEDLASGLVLFWSIRNPGYPEKVLHTPYAVTALDFSRRNTTLLAVGFYNGDIAVYDVRREADWERPMESSIGMPGSHSDPVWQVKWLSKGHDRAETLISISTDGNVLQWSLKKGLLVSLLMQLKRGGAGEGWISRQASGLCFDFAPDEHGTYITGTEEGDIHRCSISYNEQYLDTYEPHSGPVYRLRYSPWWGDIFMSCSADWTMSLFHMRSNAPLLCFHSGGEDFSINDICWCPGNSTIFGAVTADAKLQIWDIAVSDIDPIVSLDTSDGLEEEEDKDVVDASAANGTGSGPGTSSGHRGGTAMNGTRQTYSRADRQGDEGGGSDNSAPVARLLKNLKSGAGTKRTLTSLLFSENSPVMVVGDSKGAVTVYRVRDDVITPPSTSSAEQKERLQQAVWRQTDPAEAAKLQAPSSLVMGGTSGGAGGDSEP